MTTKPDYIKEAFTCPHCGVYAEMHWWMTEGLGDEEPDWVREALVSIVRCHHCDQVNVWQGAAMVWPREGDLKFPPNEKK